MTGAAIDRVHFLDEQRRNRRRSLRFSVFAVVAVGLAGIPLCVLASPLLFGLVLFGGHLVDLIAPLSEAQWDKLHDVAFALPNVWAKIRGRPVDVPWSTLAMLYVAPGALFMLLSWPFIQLLSRTAGAGMMLRRLGSRDPNPSVLAEQQLANVVQEMAIAAGVPPPAVRIIESPAVNAVAIGLTTDDAVLLATTGFLDRLDRDERQAIVAHLVGSVGNGDLEIAAIILSVFQTWGLVALLLETPLDASRRALVRRFVGLSMQAARGRVDAEDARALLDRLLGGGEFGVALEEFCEPGDHQPQVGGARVLHHPGSDPVYRDRRAGQHRSQAVDRPVHDSRAWAVAGRHVARATAACRRHRRSAHSEPGCTGASGEHPRWV